MLSMMENFDQKAGLRGSKINIAYYMMEVEAEV